MSRAPRPEDLLDLRVPVQVRISPDGSQVAFTVREAAPARDGYRHALWLVPADGSAPARRLSLGRKNDTTPRWSPDGRSLAFISDRSGVLQAAGAGDRPGRAEAPKEGNSQVWLLPMDGGEARQLTRFPRDISDIAWSPDGKRLCVVSAATSLAPLPTPSPDKPPVSDIRQIDRLFYQLNGVGFTYDRPGRLWRVDVASGEAVRLTSGADASDAEPAWSPDGKRIAFVSDRYPDADLKDRQDVFVIPAAGGRPVRVTAGRGDQVFDDPQWSPDGAWIAANGHRFPAKAGSRGDIWLFRPVANDAGENLTAAADIFADAHMNSDLFGGGSYPIHWSGDGRWITFAAPIEGSFELWRVEVATKRLERLTDDRHFLYSASQATLPDGSVRIAAGRTTGSRPTDIVSYDVPAGRLAKGRHLEPRQLTDLMAEAWADIVTVEPQSRWHEVEGRRIQGWFLPAATPKGAPGASRKRPAPLVVEIHGGPQTLYGWSLIWEWQCLVAQGISVYACNPRGSQGYGQDFCAANFGDWGTGPMADVMGGVDALVADGLADADRLGVTGGSYGGYLTSWIVGHTDRFKAAVTCRSVNDMTSQMMTGDIAGPQFGQQEYGANPWHDPALYLRESPLTYAPNIHTPLLIQHSEKDLRTPMGQAEELFTVLRALKRPVRLMRVPDETHELTRSGTPFRRVDNLTIIRDWFRHFLVDGKRGLPRVVKRRSQA
ncbi:MAG: S9 family peptidase [Candidatus Limnocylindrales bacterium]